MLWGLVRLPWLRVLSNDSATVFRKLNCTSTDAVEDKRLSPKTQKCLGECRPIVLACSTASMHGGLRSTHRQDLLVVILIPI